MNPSDDIQRIQQVYSTTYRPDPQDRSYIWNPRNPVSVYYRQAQERALVALFDDFDLPLDTLAVLDVGCGGGGFLRFLASLGAPPHNLHGLDLMPHRIEQARSLCPPGVDLRAGDAQSLPYPDAHFDLVSQLTVFSSVFDPQIRAKIAGEMRRVLKPGGYVLWYDMRVGNTKTTRGVEAAEIRLLFPGCRRLALRPLHPPRAAQIARRSWLLAELWDRVPGPKKTHYLALLQKSAS